MRQTREIIIDAAQKCRALRVTCWGESKAKYARHLPLSRSLPFAAPANQQQMMQKPNAFHAIDQLIYVYLIIEWNILNWNQLLIKHHRFPSTNTHSRTHTRPDTAIAKSN